MYYFSYGSNMSVKRLQSRVPSATKVGIGILDRHALKFHKVSKSDGSAKCDAHNTDLPEHFIYGVVYQMAEHEKPHLDRIEGLGYGYEVKEVWIRLHDGATVKAFTYYATHIDAALRPFDWYKDHVLRGARENELPEAYIHQIEAVACEIDHDKNRREKELSIYR